MKKSWTKLPPISAVHRTGKNKNLITLIDTYMWDEWDFMALPNVLSNNLPKYVVTFDRSGDNHGRGFILVHRKEKLKTFYFKDKVYEQKINENYIVKNKLISAIGSIESPYWVLKFQDVKERKSGKKVFWETAIDLNKRAPIFYGEINSEVYDLIERKLKK